MGFLTDDFNGVFIGTHSSVSSQSIENGLYGFRVIQGESGIIGDAYPGLDMISFGPTIRFPHSPDEKVHIGSVGKFWDFLVKTLEEVPEK